MVFILKKIYIMRFVFSLLKHKFLGLEMPTLLVWSLTNRCNLSCHYCGRPELRDSKSDLIDDELINLLKTAIKNKVRLISLTGGEPILHPNFKEFVKLCFKNGVLISLNSNGHRIEENIGFLKAYTYQVIVSLDGDEKSHDQIRGKGSFKKAISAINALKKNNIKTSATCVVSSKTIKDLKSIMNFIKEKKIKTSFQPVFKTKLTGEDHSIELSKTDTTIFIDTIVEEKKAGNSYILNSLKTIHTWAQIIKNPTHTVKCKAGISFARISPNGVMNRCGRVTNDLISFSDVSSDGFLESFKKLQEAPDCRTCSSWSAIKFNEIL